MKKALIHLSMLCLLAALVMPLTGCKKEENMEVEETPAATEAPVSEPAMGTSSMGTDTGTMGTGSSMGTDTGTMGTDSGAMGTGAMGTGSPSK
jgi:hypothetical protein